MNHVSAKINLESWLSVCGMIATSVVVVYGLEINLEQSDRCIES